MPGAETAALWAIALQKEALDLMISLWPSLEDADRDRLVAAIVSGPPVLEPETPDEEPERHQRIRDRRVFDRLTLLERHAPPVLPMRGSEELARLRQQYPQKLEPGDRALFTFWMEATHGHDTEHNVEELLGLRKANLVRTLIQQDENRGGLLEVWQAAARQRPMRAIVVLAALAASKDGGPADVWRSTLWGLRDAKAGTAIVRRLFSVLARAPETVLRTPEFIAAAADALEEASKRQTLPIDTDTFWRLWDRLLGAALAEPDDEEMPEDDNWVSRALNRPIGDLSTALLNSLFNRRPRAGDCLPQDLRPRFDCLVKLSRRCLGSHG